MWTIIILVIIGIILAIVLGWGMDLEDILLRCFILATISLFIGLIIALALPTEREKIITYHNLEALQDGNKISGNFFLGSGNINGNMCYVFYYEENGLFKMGQLRSNSVSINYVEGKPVLETIKEMEKEDAFINYFALDHDCSFSTEYIMHVPKGTIKQNYNLDAQ